MQAARLAAQRASKQPPSNSNAPRTGAPRIQSNLHEQSGLAAVSEDEGGKTGVAVIIK